MTHSLELPPIPGSTAIRGRTFTVVVHNPVPALSSNNADVKRENSDLGRSVVVTKAATEDLRRLGIQSFLNDVYHLCELGDAETACYRVYDVLDRMMIDGVFSDCDEVLRRVQVEKLDLKVLDSFLAITYPAKSKLTARADLFGRIERRMTELKTPVKTREIISHLK